MERIILRVFLEEYINYYNLDDSGDYQLFEAEITPLENGDHYLNEDEG